MSNQFRAAVAMLAATLPLTLFGVPVPAALAAAAKAHPQTSQARLGGRFGRRSPVLRSRYRPPSRRPYTRSYRRSPLRGFFGGVLKVLGVAYLAHLLFGWGGGGGSPFGLLLLAGIVLWLATRRRRYPHRRAV